MILSQDLQLITSSKTIFLVRSHSRVLGSRTWTYLLGESSFYLLHPPTDMHTHRPLPLLVERFLVYLDTEILGKIQARRVRIGSLHHYYHLFLCLRHNSVLYSKVLLSFLQSIVGYIYKSKSVNAILGCFNRQVVS